MAGTVKRKRRVNDGCTNPLFVKWVEELRDEAIEKGSKSHYAYSKALSSLRRYPLPLSSGQEAKVLDHVGEKLAKYLDCRLKEHKENLSNINDDEPVSNKPHPPGAGKKKRKRSTPELASSSSDPPSDVSPPVSKRRKSAPREYIPVYRSGPYALLIALYEAEQKPSWRGFLKKADLIAEAQPYSDSSFTVSEAGSYYNAWSSMTNLVERGLIIRYSRPPKFKLSEKGVSLTVRLPRGGIPGSLSQSQSGVASQTSAQRTPARSTTNSSRKKAKRNVQKETRSPPKAPSPPSTLSWSPDNSPSASDLTISYSPNTQSPQSLNHSQPTPDQSLNQSRRLEFWYVNPDGQHVHSKDEAAITFNEELSVGFLVKCRRRDLEQSVFKYMINSLRPPDGEFIFAYLSNEQGPDYSNPPLISHDHTPNSSRSTQHTSPARKSSANNDHHKSPVVDVITLSDSEPEDCVGASLNVSLNCSSSSDDVEILKPLSERVGFNNKAPEIRSTSSPKSSVSRHIAEQKKLTKTPANNTTAFNKPLTPAQNVGMAAIRRLSNLRPTNHHSSTDSSTRVSTKRVSETESSRSPGIATTFSRAVTSESAIVVDLTSDGNHDIECSSSSHSSSKTVSRSKASDTSHQTATKTQCTGVNHPPPKQTQTGRVSQQSSQSANKRAHPSSTEHTEIPEDTEPEFVLRPGDFEVILCVDSAESTASRKHTSQFRGLLLQELGKNGVPFDVRKLNVGDFLWVGREKAHPVPGQLSLPRSREVVLEYIVERKRMDDLAGSITDGRFREQKFRLKSCGLSRPVYLVEEYQDMAHMKMPLRNLNQAIAHTQVIDGFFVKKTKDIRESIAYLTVMTRQLQAYYANKILKAYPHETVTELVRTKHQQSTGAVVHSMPFSSFNDASIKNKVLSVYEMFGRQLMQLPGFSADKAVAVLEHYPTVSHLRESYRKCSNTERVKLLSDIKAGKTKRRLGDSASSLIYSLYWLGKDT